MGECIIMRFFVAALAFGMSWGSYASPVMIKFATVAPEGSTWMEVLKGAAAEIKTKTKSNVEFKLYPGGIAGDEPDVLRKMRVGQYHAAGFTGVGLGEVLPEIRIVELPLFYRSVEEIDYIKSRLTHDFEEKFKAKGQIFLGWAEPGLVYILTQKPIQNADDMKGVKLWAWEGDPLAEAVIRAFKVAPVNIALPDVLMGLQTGMITAVYAPPMAAMALQWHTKVKYMVNEPLTNSTGGLLISKKIWDQISPADQVTVKSVIQTSLGKLNEITRRQNNEAIEKFKQLGIKVETINKAGHDEMVSAAAQIRPQLVGKLYSADLLKRVEGYVEEFRNKKGAKK
jgi:TRAP-type transport system periplasmic protein